MGPAVIIKPSVVFLLVISSSMQLIAAVSSPFHITDGIIKALRDKWRSNPCRIGRILCS